MAFDNLRLTVNSGEARYLKKTVGHALNQCITELIQVRPTDPVEYMGYWMRRYVDSRNYFQKKQLYYKELVAETSSIASMRLAREEHLQEAIETLQVAMNEAEHGTEIQTTHKSSFSIPPSSSTSSSRRKGSKGGTTNEPESPIDEGLLPVDGEGLPRDGEGLPVEDSNLLSGKMSRTRSSSNVPIRVGSKTSSPKIGSDTQMGRRSLPRSGGSSTTFIPHEDVPISISPVPTPKRKSFRDHKVAEAQKKSELNEIEARKKSDNDDASSNSSSNLAEQLTVRHRSGSLDVIVASWKVKNTMIYCYHPILGMLSPQQQRIETAPVDEWMTKDPPAECFYDHELYLVPKELKSEEQSKRTSSVQDDKSVSDMTPEEYRASLESSKSPGSGSFLTLQGEEGIRRRLLSISD